MKYKLKKPPRLKYVFFNKKDDTLLKLNERLEKTIEQLSQSKNRKIIVHLNEIPILMPKAVTSPFKNIPVNILLLLTSPLNIFIYVRSIRFRIKLFIDLTRAEQKIREIKYIIKNEELINLNK